QQGELLLGEAERRPAHFVDHEELAAVQAVALGARNVKQESDALAATNEHGLGRDEPVLASREDDSLRFLQPFGKEEEFLLCPVDGSPDNLTPRDLIFANAEKTCHHRCVALEHCAGGQIRISV